MPTPIRTWTVSINNAFGTVSSQLIQFQEALWNLKSTLVAAGWTVTRSSNTVTASAADNWTSSTNVVLGLAGAGSWIVLQSPSSWPNAPGPVYVSLYVNNATGDTTPQTIGLRISTLEYTGGTTAALPTTLGVETAVLTNGDDIIPWTTYTTGNWASWRSSRGDVLFGVKPTGTNQFRFFTMLVSMEDGNGDGVGTQRWFFYSRNNTTNVLAATDLQSSANVRSVDAGGNTLVTTGVLVSPLWLGATAWTGGLDFQGETNDMPIDVYQDSSSGGRWMGQFVDAYAAPTNIPFGTTIGGDITFTFTAIGAIWVPVPIASLPFS
jgi:hypothetical protein